MTQELSLEEAKRGNRLVHGSLLAGIILINILLYFSLGDVDLTPNFNLGPVSMGILAFSAAAIFMAHSIFSKRITVIGSDTLNNENKRELTAAYILKWAILEMALLVNTLSIYFILPKGSAFVHYLMIFFALAIMYLSRPKS